NKRLICLDNLYAEVVKHLESGRPRVVSYVDLDSGQVDWLVEAYTLSLHDALPILRVRDASAQVDGLDGREVLQHRRRHPDEPPRSEEHTSELQSRSDLVCRLLLEKKKQKTNRTTRSFVLSYNRTTSSSCTRSRSPT